MEERAGMEGISESSVRMDLGEKPCRIKAVFTTLQEGEEPRVMGAEGDHFLGIMMDVNPEDPNEVACQGLVMAMGLREMMMGLSSLIDNVSEIMAGEENGRMHWMALAMMLMHKAQEVMEQA